MDMNNFILQLGVLLESTNTATVDTVTRLLRSTTGTVYVIGNGGSALTGTHFAQDLFKACNVRAMSLSDNVGLLTAYANDESYENIFLKQVKLLLRPEDVLVCISGSGNSTNVVKAAAYASDVATVVSLTGSFGDSDGGLLRNLSDLNLHARSKNMYIIESYHSALLHYIIERLS